MLSLRTREGCGPTDLEALRLPSLSRKKGILERPRREANKEWIPCSRPLFQGFNNLAFISRPIKPSFISVDRGTQAHTIYPGSSTKKGCKQQQPTAIPAHHPQM